MRNQPSTITTNQDRQPMALRLALLVVFLCPTIGLADTVTLTSGESLDGIIQWMEDGRVRITLADGERSVELSDVLAIDFNTPHLTEGTPSQPLEHFTENIEGAEMDRLVQQLTDSRYELHILLGEIQNRWRNRSSVGPDEVAEWNADKERFQAPLADYQETLRELYLHVLGHVDDYNFLASDAHELYVGVDGIFRVGSPLVPDDQTELPWRQFLPSGLVDELYYEGYKDGADITRRLMELDEQSPNNRPQRQTDDEN